MPDSGKPQAAAETDGDDRLIAADEPLASLQRRCGGEIPGTIAVPAIAELVTKARSYGFKLARQFSASDGSEQISAWAEIEPLEDGGTRILIDSWQAKSLPPEDLAELAERKAGIDRVVAELTAELDADQAIRSVDCDATDLAELARAMREGVGMPWTDFVSIAGDSHRQPLHWRLLDGANLKITGSDRGWRASLLPRLAGGAEPEGFELLFTAEVPLAEPVRSPDALRAKPSNAPGLVGRDVAPVLRQPIARIIANAETIRTRLAGPLADEYSNYAADIAAAGQHLLALIDDLADLEVVEAEEFNTAPDRIDLADVARRAAGILGVRAAERGITIDAPRDGETMPAIAEFRRVLQVLLNLVGNAIGYSPDNSQVWIRLEGEGARARVIVADQGPGIAPEQQERLFDKFERLGRSDAAGSGLGLYISRRLARAMGGELTVESALGQGARFTLDVPADLLALSPTTAQYPE
jgi:signal transduction histidine kinase